MINFDRTRQPSIESYVSGSDLNSVSRLIVLISSLDADLTAVTRRLWKLAVGTKTHVWFIGLCTDATHQPSLKRTLVTQAALLNSSGVSADVEIIVGKDPVNVVTSHIQPSDMFVCWNEPAGSLYTKVNMILEANPDIPVYVLSEPRSKSNSDSRWLPTVAGWIGSIGIILAFFWLQVQIDHLAIGSPIVFQVISVALEFWLLMTWNRLLA